MTMEEVKSILAGIAERQKLGENTPCPRCGKSIVDPHTNALSRTIDIGICEECGVSEAMRAYHRQEPLNLMDWSIIQKERDSKK